MKTSILILSFVFGSNFFGYSQSLSPNRDVYSLGPRLVPQNVGDKNEFFSSFAGGLNALFNKSEAGASFDLSLQTYHYFIVLKKKQSVTSITKKDQSTISGTKDSYRGIDIYLFNRAAINFDSLKSIANDYLTSLQTSPLTLRINKEWFLTKNKEITEGDYSPVVSTLLTGDGRAIPYGDINNKVSVGFSGHLYLTLSASFKRIEFDSHGNEIDKGVIYFQPSFGVAYGTDAMMKNVFIDRSNRPLLSSECRIGFRSDNNTVKDWGILARYTWENITGPKFRIGITLAAK